MKMHFIATYVATLILLTGCAAPKMPAQGTPAQSTPAQSTPVADVDGVVVTAEQLLQQPSEVVVKAQDFDALVAAAERAARVRLFTIDRRDPRNGLLVTAPLVASQVFEPWRQDQRTAYDTAQSTLATHRRTIRFEIVKSEDGGLELSPKVLVERYSQAENRVTSVVLYRTAFRPQRDASLAAYGTRESDRGLVLEKRYWYPVGRDPALEASLASDIQRALGS